MLHRPAFKPYFHVEQVAEDGTFLLSELGHFVLFGAPNNLVASAIDGRRTADEIVDSLVDRVTMEELYLSLATLERDGYLIESDPDAHRAEAALWASLGVDSRVARERAEQATVGARSTSGPVPASVKVALARAGLRISQDATVSLVFTDDYLRPELLEINEEHIRTGRPWLLVKPEGAYTWLGPIFVPGRTACWRCLEHRLRANREVESLLERRGRTGPFPVSLAALPATIDATIELAALQLRMFVSAGETSVLLSRIVTMNWATLEQRSHTVVRRPQCETCGDAFFGAEQ